MRILVVESDRTQPLRELVRLAARRVDREPTELVDQLGEGGSYPDAIIRDVSNGARFETPWRIPRLAVDMDGGASPSADLLLATEDRLFAREEVDEAGIAAVADWLRQHVNDVVGLSERLELELLVQELRRGLDAKSFNSQDPEEVAQAEAAVETMEVQLRAPRSSKTVLRWAAGQIPGFMIGLLSNVGNDVLTHFMHW